MEYGEEAQGDAVTSVATVRRRSRFRPAIALLQQFGGYLLTGGAATLVDVLIFSLLVRSGLYYVLALGVSFGFGVLTNFTLSRRFVFGVYWRSGWTQFLVFSMVALNSLLANLGLLQVLIRDLNWEPAIARLVSAACVAILSFTGHKLYSFDTKQTLAEGAIAERATR
jgi:putative flippase GtrA